MARSIRFGHQPRIDTGDDPVELLAHAGAHADIIGLQGLGRTRPDGHEHSVQRTVDHLERQLDEVRAGAGERFDEIELNALVQLVTITDDAGAALAEVAAMIGDGTTTDELAEIPYVLTGSVEEIADKIVRCRDRWGITFFAVRMLDDFAPVIERVRELEERS